MHIYLVYFIFLTSRPHMKDILVVQLHGNSQREKLTWRIPCITMRSHSPKGTWEKRSRFGDSGFKHLYFHLNWWRTLCSQRMEYKLTPTDHNDYERSSKRSTLWFELHQLNLPRSDNASLGKWATFGFNRKVVHLLVIWRIDTDNPTRRRTDL